MRYYKYLFFLALVTLFSFILFLSKNSKYNNIYFYDDKEYGELMDNVYTSKERNIHIINSISVNNNYCSYDINTDSFLCYLENIDNRNFSLKVDSNLDYSLFSNFNFKISNFETTNIVMYTKKYYYVINLKFTNLPIMSVKSLPKISKEKLEFSDVVSGLNLDKTDESKKVFDASDSYISLIENNHSVIYSKANLQIRGHDSSIYDKKSYKLSLMKKEKNSLVKNNIKLLGMYKDDDWVLDAMYIDYSKIRNKLSSDLWRMITDQNILNGNYVELFIDNDYKGLYLLKEFINKESLNLESNGSLFKAVLYLTVDDTNINYVHDKYFLLKNPDFSNNSSNHILNVLDNYYSCISTGCDISDLILNEYDIDNFLNYKVFISLIKGVDNNEHNNYYLAMANNNSKIIKVPWDMDLSFGFTFLRKNDYQDVKNMGFALYYENSPVLNDLIKERYWDVRRNKLSPEDLKVLVDTYKNEIMNSGSLYRDSERWNVDVKESEFDNIIDWIYRRFEFLDEFYR